MRQLAAQAGQGMLAKLANTKYIDGMQQDGPTVFSERQTRTPMVTYTMPSR